MSKKIQIQIQRIKNIINFISFQLLLSSQSKSFEQGAMDKEQSKPIQSLTFEQLFKMAEEKEQEFDYDEAEYFYQMAYIKSPLNEAIVMCYANILKQNDKGQQAQTILEKSIKENPNGTYKRYFELGQIYHGVQAIKSFETGIQQAFKSLKNPFKTITPEAEIKRDISQAYATIAEICMTDLIDQPQAQVKCTQALEKGVKMDPKCMDVHLQVANYQLFKQNFEIARNQLNIIFNGVKSKQQEYDNDMILQAAKYFIELDEFEKSSELLETIHESESNESQIVYLLAYCAFKGGKYDECEDYIEEYQDGTNAIKDEQVEDAMTELIAELKKIPVKSEKAAKKPKGQMQQTGQNNDEEDLQNDGDWMDVEDQDN